jgi:hypothetical protein
VRRKTPVAIGIGFGYALAIALMYWRVARGLMANFDCTAEYWPDLEFQLGALRDGELPLWNPYSLGGYSFAGDVQAGTFAPLNWVCWLVGAITGPTPWLIQLKVWLAMWFGLVGVHLLVQRRTGRHAPAAIAALCFVFGAPLLAHKNGAYLWPYLFLPWAVLALDRFIDASTPRRAVGLAIGVWLIGTAGHPHAFFACLVLLGGLWVARVAGSPRGAFAQVVYAQVPGLAIAVVLASLLLAATYLPAIDAVEHSPRAHRALGYVLGGGIHASKYGELFVPDVDGHWSLGLYMGPLAVIAPLFAVWAARTRAERIERSYWILAATFALVIASGGVVLRLLAEYVPGFDLFRIANRWKSMAALPIAILIGDAVAAALRRPPLRGWPIAWLATAGIVIVTGTVIKLDAVNLVLTTTAQALVVGTVWWRRGTWCTWLLVPVVFGALFQAGWIKMTILGPPPSVERAAAVAAKLPGAERDWRYLDVGQGGIPRWGGMVLGRRDLGGHSNPVTVQRREALTVAAKTPPLVYTHFNARWFTGAAPPGSARVNGTPFREYARAAPLVRWYAGAAVVDAEAALALLGQTPPDELRQALVDPAGAPRGLPTGDAEPVDGHMITYARNELTAEIDSPAPGIVVINETWFPGWEATVDGAPAHIARVNYLLRGVLVPAGHHRIVMRFAPRGYPWVYLAFVVGLIVGAAILVAPTRWWPRWLAGTRPAEASAA